MIGCVCTNPYRFLSDPPLKIFERKFLGDSAAELVAGLSRVMMIKIEGIFHSEGIKICALAFVSHGLLLRSKKRSPPFSFQRMAMNE